MLSLVISGDGSHTLLDTALDEQYHSRHGAISESVHVFIQAGLHYVARARQNIRILEIGFGTGLNALLTYHENNTLKKEIEYMGLEPFPLDNKVISALNYCELVDEKKKEEFHAMHSVPNDTMLSLQGNFTFMRSFSGIGEWQSSKCFDLVYYDVFSPEKQPGLWTGEIFERLFMLMSDHSCLVTYCAKGEVKRNLKKAGFKVESLPGPPGKREMVRALKG